ncbi:Hint domain-containing protein [Achromobacter sp. RTa]|uniref:Hint domain-containing protein n=1 Tax=Achromobacter sp. RTa TaxID=1532557 RepID=UPI0009DDE101|nr:Hint domain-containing protein [Achromobacter sp. RTa]
MALNISVGANSTETINSANAPTDDIVNAQLLGNSDLIIDGVDISLNATIGAGVLQSNTVSAVNGANVVVTGVAGVTAANAITYNIGADSSLQYGGELLDVSLLENTKINFDANGTGTLKVIMPTVDLNLSSFPTISGLKNGDQLIVEKDNLIGANTVGNNVVFNEATGVLQVQYVTSGPIPITTNLASFQITDYPPGATFSIDAAGNVTFACYLRGTRIATVDGEKLVEDIQAGDRVITARGGVATVKWVGHRKLNSSRIKASDAIRAYPVRFAAGSLALNVPKRDLYVSPGHHMYFDGKLVPAMLLVNGQTVTQEFDRTSFEYFHIELDHFDILIAEGAAAESYVDTGNRNMFENATSVAMNPDFGPADGRPQIEGIEVVRSGPVVEALRKSILQRAEKLTGARRVTETGLHLQLGGRTIHSASQTNEGPVRFELPTPVLDDVIIASRSAVVRDTTTHARRDLRTVGVGVSRIVVETSSGRHDIDLQHPALEGLHEQQDVHGVSMRWTGGAARIPAALLEGAIAIELHVLRTYTYWQKAA